MEFFQQLPVLKSSALTLMLTLVLSSLMERLCPPCPVGYILAGTILGPQDLVAYSTPNAARQRLIDEPVLDAAVVLVILSSLISLVLAGRATRRLQGGQESAPAATPREAA